GLEPFYSSGATDPHAASMALPIFGPLHENIGALVLSGPSMRLTADYAKAIRSIFIEVADDLTRSLGGKSFGEEKVAHRAPAVDEAV
ncbi:transcriptional regulator, partial [Pseudomonas syringae pv. pisi]